jgi:hypothetical protein
MFVLIVLATMTNLGTYPTQGRCEAAVRSIYEQKLDPYHMIKPAVLKKIVDNQMKYSAPFEYRCQRV